MSKLLTMLIAGALALTLSGFAAAADKDYDTQKSQAAQPADPAAAGATSTTPAVSEKGSTQQPADAAAAGATSTQPAISEKATTQQPGDPAAGGATVSQQEQEYLAALKKCEPLSGADKTKCVDAAKKKHGQM